MRNAGVGVGGRLRYEFFAHGNCGHFNAGVQAEAYFRDANEAVRAMERERARGLNAKHIIPQLMP